MCSFSEEIQEVELTGGFDWVTLHLLNFLEDLLLETRKQVTCLTYNLTKVFFWLLFLFI